jgi:hypothetical protein
MKTRAIALAIVSIFAAAGVSADEPAAARDEARSLIEKAI